MPMNEVPGEVVAAIRAVVKKPCWNVSAGGLAGKSFSLAFGTKVPRSRPLNNPEATEDYRLFHGELTLLVWCSWRLDGPNEVIASGDQEPEIFAPRLRRALIGSAVSTAEVRSAACDLRIEFDGNFVLHVFCDRMPEPDIDGDNWQIESADRVVAAGPGVRVTAEARK